MGLRMHSEYSVNSEELQTTWAKLFWFQGKYEVIVNSVFRVYLCLFSLVEICIEKYMFFFLIVNGNGLFPPGEHGYAVCQFTKSESLVVRYRHSPLIL